MGKCCPQGGSPTACPAAAGHSWKGGAGEQADDVFFCRRYKKDVVAKRTLRPRGAGDRTRTGTLSPAVDFESTTSTNSITPADRNKITGSDRDSFYIITKDKKICKRNFLLFGKNLRSCSKQLMRRLTPFPDGQNCVIINNPSSRKEYGKNLEYFGISWDCFAACKQLMQTVAL